MKRKNLTALLAAMALGVSLTGCTGVSVNTNDDVFPDYTQVADPIKDNTDNGSETDTDTAGVDDNTDNGGDTDIAGTDNTDNEVDDEKVYQDFLNDKVSASFDHIVENENTSYTLSGLFDAEKERLLGEFVGYETDEEPEFSASAQYAYIDCGDDGIRELAIHAQYILLGSQVFDKYYVFKNMKDGLKCCGAKEGYYRSFASLNEYGVFTYGGSGGANVYYQENQFVDGDGVCYFISSESHIMGFSEPMVPLSYIPDAKKKDGIYSESFKDNGYTAVIYFFDKSPRFPEEAYDSDGNANQELIDKYNEEYQEWLDTELITFEDEYETPNILPSGAVKKYLDDNDIKYYSSDEMKEIFKDYYKQLGLTEKVFNGEEPEWKDLR